MRKRDGLWLGGALWAVLGCGGNAVDLGERSQRGVNGFADVPATATDPLEPQTVFESDVMGVFGFSAEDTTLYALVETGAQASLLVSCPIDRCKSELSTLTNSALSPASDSSLRISGDWLYWKYLSDRPRDGVAACRKSGCDAPRLVEAVGRGELASDGDYIYWVDAANVLQRWNPGGGAPEPVVTVNAREVVHLAVTAEHIYFTERDLKSILRLRRDGTGDVEIVAHTGNVSSLELTSDAFFYTSQILTGKVQSCPLAGCGERGRDLVLNQRWPSGLSIASDELFWLSLDGEWGDGTLSSCRLPGCAEPRVWRSGLRCQKYVDYNPLPQSLAFHVGERYVWWLEGPESAPYGSALRRLPR